MANKSGPNLEWLIKLRWGSVAGQLATIFGVYWFLGIRIPLIPLLGVVGLEAVSNLVVDLWFRKNEREVREWQVAAVMCLDVLFLTLLLFLTGGPRNPFGFLYLVNIALAAVALHAQWTWMLVAFAMLCIGMLPLTGFYPLPLEHLEESQRQQIYQQGMWVALGVSAGFIVHFLLRITRDLAEREKELSAAQQLSARQKQLASLATVAAGAAHELATPLGTIALVAKELERNLSKREEEQEVVEDLRLVREQVARCRLILDQMAGGLGPSSEQVVEETRLPKLLQAALEGVRTEPAVHVEIEDGAREYPLHLPGRAVSQALRALITNAQDASPRDQIVRVLGGLDEGRVKIEVIDTGAGMTDETLSRVSEPFFTTKPPGSGMGLGLYLTRAVVESLRGHMHLESKPEEGTRVRIDLPLQVQLEDIRDHAQPTIDTHS